MTTAKHRFEDVNGEPGSAGVNSASLDDLSDPTAPPPLARPLRIAVGLLLLIVSLGLTSVADNIYGAHGKWIDETGIAAMAVVGVLIFVLRERHSRAWIGGVPYPAEGRGIIDEDAAGGAADS